MEPAVAQRFAGHVRHAVIAVHDEARRRAAHNQLAGVAGRRLAAVGIDDLGFPAVEHLSTRALASGRVLRRVDDGADLGRAVELDEAAAEALLERGRPFGHRHAPAEAGAVVPVGRSARLLPKHGEGGAHEIEDGRLQRAHLVPVAGEAEALADGRDRPQEQRGCDRHDGCVEVEQRVRAIENIVLLEPQALDDTCGLSEHEAV